MPGTVVGTGDTLGDKTDTKSCPQGNRDNEQINEAISNK